MKCGKSVVRSGRVEKKKVDWDDWLFYGCGWIVFFVDDLLFMLLYEFYLLWLLKVLIFYILCLIDILW